MSLFLRNLFFTLLQPGLVAGAFPYVIAKMEFETVFESPMGVLKVIGLIVCIVGVVITCHCIFKFATEGHGTLSPADPTTRLVIKGLYKYSRNPMYVGVMMILLGECLFTLNLNLLLYSILIFTAFNLFIIYWEEPRLTKDFGEEYITYQKQVRRWI